MARTRIFCQILPTLKLNLYWFCFLFEKDVAMSLGYIFYKIYDLNRISTNKQNLRDAKLLLVRGGVSCQLR